MANTEISVYSISNLNVKTVSFSIEALKDNSLPYDKLNYTNKAFEVQALRHGGLDRQSKFYAFSNEVGLFQGLKIKTAADIAAAKTYLLRARKTSDNSFIYWRSENADVTGVDSGYSRNEFYDVCIITYN